MEWDTLLDTIETEEVRTRSEPVDAPPAVVAMLDGLRERQGADGPKIRAYLPITSLAEFTHVKRVLRKASDLMVPLASVTTKGVYAEDDEYMVETTDEAGVVTRKLTIREGAVPQRIAFTVGERRGKKSEKTDESSVEAAPVEPAEPKTRKRGGK